MPPADLAAARPAASGTVVGLEPAGVTGWGGGAPAPVTVARPAAVEALRAALVGGDLAERLPGGAIARGMGRSYGDAAQLSGGLVVDATALRDFGLDSERGIVTAQAGVTLGTLLAAGAPAGWTLPTVPGTQHVSVGGAIASDVHGKNHGAVGSLGAHVLGLELLTAAGDVMAVSRDQDPELLDATIGGMGLTGVILSARIQLRPLTGATLAVDIERVESLDAALAALQAPGGPHRVAWLDLLGPVAVRGVVTRAEHLPGPIDAAAADAMTVRGRATLPAAWPGGLLRPAAVRAHNALRFRLAPRRAEGHPESFGMHMFPLDALDAWPRLYGPAGFVQYQLAVPRGQEPLLGKILERLRRSAVPCYLAVLKDFGPGNDAPLSFPIEGWTLALDLPRGPAGLEGLLRGFDELVAAAGGRVYLSKDSRMAADVMGAMYPRLGEWRAVRDRVDPEHVWRSDLAVRTGLVPA